MIEKATTIVAKYKLPIERKDGVSLVTVESPESGLEIAKDILYGVVDEKTVLFLSGGTTPKPLYEVLAKENRLKVGAIALVDERYGPPLHTDSNEKMIQNTGVVISYPILQTGLDRVQTAQEYNNKVQELFLNFSSSVAVLGIGSDGHTAGIAPNRDDFTNPVFSQTDALVSSFTDLKSMTEGGFGERITLTFRALSSFTLLLILVFGSSKQEALTEMFRKGPLEEIPARFFLEPNVVQKTLLITDQKV